MAEKAHGEKHSASQVMPLYFKIFLILDREIRNGQYPHDCPLPSEEEIALRFGVSRVTVRHAMAMLATDKLIKRHRGRGTFVSLGDATRPAVSGFDGLNRNVNDFEEKTQVKILSAGPGTLPGWAREHAGAARGDVSQCIIRSRYDQKGPFSYSACYLSEDAASRLDIGKLKNRTILAALEDQGIVAARVEQRLTAVAAAPEIADYLDVIVGAPLTLMRRAMFDETGDPFEFLEVYYRPDRFEYSVDLSRESEGTGPPQWVSKRGVN